jgi:uncharacterized repeat protein (TIGR04042 family)
MPALHYTILWPDETQTQSYSPSLVIRDFLAPGTDYAVDDFLRRVREATAIANQRVEAKFGFVCSRANDQLQDTERRVAALGTAPGLRIRVLAFKPA